MSSKVTQHTNTAANTTDTMNTHPGRHILQKRHRHTHTHTQRHTQTGIRLD